MFGASLIQKALPFTKLVLFWRALVGFIGRRSLLTSRQGDMRELAFVTMFTSACLAKEAAKVRRCVCRRALTILSLGSVRRNVS